MALSIPLHQRFAWDVSSGAQLHFSTVLADLGDLSSDSARHRDRSEVGSRRNSIGGELSI
jgi:hypothetical protein